MAQATRDIVVVGASAGGVQPLAALARGLPPDFPAAVFVVLHVSPRRHSMLAEILDRSGPLPATAAVDGEPIRHGRIYVAPPDRQLVLDGGIRVVDERPVDLQRPSVDVLFRSAAEAFARRVIAVVLSGMLHDGAAGVAAVKRAGGLAIVQDPRETLHRGMPSSALAAVTVDHVLPAGGIAGCLQRLVREPIGADVRSVRHAPSVSRPMPHTRDDTRNRFAAAPPVRSGHRRVYGAP